MTGKEKKANHGQAAAAGSRHPRGTDTEGPSPLCAGQRPRRVRESIARGTMIEKTQPNNPLHGITLKAMLEDLVARRGWPELGLRIRVACFNENPSIESSLKFLRKTDWARVKVENLYLEDQQRVDRNRKRNERRAGMRTYRAEQEAAQKDGVAETPAPEDLPEE